MTPDDFKQKCDEIHSIVCYLLSDNDISKPNYKKLGGNVEIGKFVLWAENIIKYSALEMAIVLSDEIKVK